MRLICHWITSISANVLVVKFHFLLIISVVTVNFLFSIVRLWSVVNELYFGVWDVGLIYQFKILGSQLLLMAIILGPLVSHIELVLLIFKHDLFVIFFIEVYILILKRPLDFFQDWISTLKVTHKFLFGLLLLFIEINWVESSVPVFRKWRLFLKRFVRNQTWVVRKRRVHLFGISEIYKCRPLLLLLHFTLLRISYNIFVFKTIPK